MNPIIYAIPIFMLTVALEFFIAWKLKGNATAGRGAGAQSGSGLRKIYSLDDTVSSMSIGILSRVAGAFPRLLTVGIYMAAYEAFASMTWDLKNPWAWIGALLLYDFFYYWKHRANHEVRIMWAGHITHHNSEYFNLSTALRQASTTFVFDWMFYLPMAVLGIPWQMFVTVALIDLLYQYWVHTELIGRLGWFDRIFVSPSNHRVHHGQDDYCIDKNYGGILIVWDRMFGTFMPEGQAPITYGVRTNLNSFNPLWSNWHYYVDIWHDFRAARGPDAKLQTLIAPPSGWTGEKLSHFEPMNFYRHQINVPKALSIYALVQLVLNVCAISAFLYAFPKMSPGVGLMCALWLVASLLAPIAMMEGRAWGRTLEIIKYMLLPAIIFFILKS